MAETTAETTDQVAASSAEDATQKDDDAPSIAELLAELGHDVAVLALCEAQLAAARNMPEVRRAGRDLAATVVAALAFLTAFAFANVAAMNALRSVMPQWLAALVLCAVWIAVGSALALALMVRAGHITGWKWWHDLRAGPEEVVEDLEQARDDAEQAVRETLGRLAPAMTVEIASASVSVAGDVTGEVVEAGSELLESSDEAVEALAENLPGGSVVNQVWDVVLTPGRYGVKVATTVLRRGESTNEA